MRSIVLLCGAATVLYGLNVVRIATLVMIGHLGAGEIATTGFHSQAGWIAFSATALSLTFIGRRFSEGGQSHLSAETEDMATALMVPFLATIAAGMIVGALSGRFEWLYGLRVLAAAAALWRYRRALARLDWRPPGWHGVAVGATVFVLWIGFEQVFGNGLVLYQATPAQLASAAVPLSAAWTAMRVIGATVTVPVVEELAFRAFLLRRFQSADVENVSMRQWTVWALIGSSVLFGALHGGRWFAGTMSGLLYAWTMLRRGNIADAVAAHSFTNALIAAAVLFLDAWNLW